MEGRKGKGWPLPMCSGRQPSSCNSISRYIQDCHGPMGGAGEEEMCSGGPRDCGEWAGRHRKGQIPMPRESYRCSTTTTSSSLFVTTITDLACFARYVP